MHTLRDVMYGLATGDALGVPWEFLARGTFEAPDMAGFGTHSQPAGTWSDDTSMALATCDSIRRRGCIDVDDIRLRFEAWWQHGAYAIDGKVFDIGGTVLNALSEGRGQNGEWSNGNGSLMRIAPLAFTDATDDEIRAVSAITHAHYTSCDVCVAFVELLRVALADPARARAMIQNEIGDRQIEDVRSGGYVVDTLEAAVWSFKTTDNFGDCVRRAVELGDDSDTTGAVAGALAGAVYGIEGIPAAWLEALRGKDIIESCLF